MSTQELAAKAKHYLDTLCAAIPNRRVGSEGNRAATRFFAETVAAFGFTVDTSSFECMDWQSEGAHLSIIDSHATDAHFIDAHATDAHAADTHYDVHASPYSPGCDVTAPLVVVASVDELEAQQDGDVILLCVDELAQEPLMPKNFPFYNPASHRRIYAALERLGPRAVLAAPARNPAMSGALYPYPLIEDGDFGIPSAYMCAEEGTRLARAAGKPVHLTIRAERIAATGENVVASTGKNEQGRVVIFAHIDAKAGTPGAIDNAAGVVVLLLLAELLRGYAGSYSIELVALNGEDYYSNPGEQLYLARQTNQFRDLLLGINIDGAGYVQGRTAYSLYNCPPALSAAIDATLSTYAGLVPGDPWYQGDHGLFLQVERPALAITSEQVMALMAEVVHTDNDRPEIVDPAKLVEVASALDALLRTLGQDGP